MDWEIFRIERLKRLKNSGISEQKTLRRVSSGDRPTCRRKGHQRATDAALRVAPTPSRGRGHRRDDAEMPAKGWSSRGTALPHRVKPLQPRAIDSTSESGEQGGGGGESFKKAGEEGRTMGAAFQEQKSDRRPVVLRSRTQGVVSRKA